MIMDQHRPQKPTTTKIQMDAVVTKVQVMQHLQKERTTPGVLAKQRKSVASRKSRHANFCQPIVALATLPACLPVKLGGKYAICIWQKSRHKKKLKKHPKRRAEYIPKIISLVRIISDMKMKYSSGGFRN